MVTVSALLVLCQGKHLSPVDAQTKTSDAERLNKRWACNRDAGEFRRHRVHYDGTVIVWSILSNSPYRIRFKMANFVSYSNVASATTLLIGAQYKIRYMFETWLQGRINNLKATIEWTSHHFKKWNSVKTKFTIIVARYCSDEGLFWCLFPSLLHNSGDKHQNHCYEKTCKPQAKSQTTHLEVGPSTCPVVSQYTWWHHQMETFSALLAFCAGNSPVTGEFPAQRPVTRSLKVFFDLHPNKRLSKQSWGWWSETPSSSLWRHRNERWMLCWPLIMCDERMLVLTQVSLDSHWLYDILSLIWYPTIVRRTTQPDPSD